MGRSAPHCLAGLVVALALVSAGQAADAPPPPPMAPAATAAPLPATQALVEVATLACRTALARRYGAAAEQVEVWLAPAIAIAIESGELALPVLRRDGLPLGWMVRGKPAPLPIGLCRTDGAGAVKAIEEQKD
ncbi:MAG: hypothetical protein WCL59_04630 [Cyanobium sp. ELA507]